MDVSADRPGVIAPPPLIYLAALLLALALRAVVRAPIAARSLLWPGLALVAAAIALALWGRQTMVAAGTNINPTRPATAIVSSGPFRYTRNPLYLSLTLLYLGLTLIANTWWGVVMLLPLAAVIHRGVVLREERYLHRKFGDAYDRYRASVRRYI